MTCDSATKTITCNCKATKPCYHIAAVAPLHSYIARQKQEAEMASQGEPVQEDPFCICCCGRDGFSFFNGTWYCIDCINEMIAAEKTQTNMVAAAERDYPDLLAPIYQAAAEYTASQAEHDRACLFG